MKNISYIVFVCIILTVMFICSCAAPAATPSPVPLSPTPTTPTTPPFQPPSPPLKPTPVSKEIELKYDDGIPEDFGAVIPQRSMGGFLVDFTAPSKSFTIRKVRAFGIIPGQTSVPEFVCQICSSDKKIVYSIKQPVSKFPTKPDLPRWVDIEIPAIEIGGQFYINLYTGTGGGAGIHLGIDESVINRHSSVTPMAVGGEEISEALWSFPSGLSYGDKAKVNWMIRVVGTYLEQ
jgi:hypothetical protein